MGLYSSPLICYSQGWRVFIRLKPKTQIQTVCPWDCASCVWRHSVPLQPTLGCCVKRNLNLKDQKERKKEQAWFCGLLGQTGFFLLCSCCWFVVFFFSFNPWLLTAKWINSLGSRILKQEFSCLPEHLIYLIYWSSESGSCVFQMWSCRSTFLSIQRTRSCLKLLEQLMKSQSSFKAIHPTSRGANEAFLGNWICSSVLSHQQPPSLPETWACVTCPADNFHKMLIFNRTCRNLVFVGPLISVVFGWNCPLSSSVRVEGSWEADEQRQGDSHRIPFL